MRKRNIQDLGINVEDKFQKSKADLDPTTNEKLQKDLWNKLLSKIKSHTAQ
jgi:hypothetical protein